MERGSIPSTASSVTFRSYCVMCVKQSQSYFAATVRVLSLKDVDCDRYAIFADEHLYKHHLCLTDQNDCLWRRLTKPFFAASMKVKYNRYSWNHAVSRQELCLWFSRSSQQQLHGAQRRHQLAKVRRFWRCDSDATAHAIV